MIELVFSRQAHADLSAIWDFIAAENEPAADRIVRAILRRTDALRVHPRMGPRRPDIAETARILVEGRYLVLYEIEPDTQSEPVDRVNIIGIVDSRRDVATLFPRP